jgi:hypothetical protein
VKRTYLDSSVLIQAVQGVDGDKTASTLCEEFITAEKPGKPLHKARGIKVSFLPTV